MDKQKWIFWPVCLAFACPAAGDELLRWQDAAGQWHFSSPAQAETGAQVFEITTPASAGLNLLGDDGVLLVPHEALRRSERPERKNKDAVESWWLQRQHLRTSCEQWRERLRRSARGLRDSDAQRAYENKCILGVRW